MEITRKPVRDFTRVFEILSYQREKYPNPRALHSFVNGVWKSYSIQEIQDHVNAVSCWLLRCGYRVGQRVMLMPLMGKPEWMILDFACQQCGLITVPVHPTSSLTDLELILRETETELCFVNDADLLTRVRSILSTGNGVKVYQLEPDYPDYFSLTSCQPPAESEIQHLEAIKRTIQPQDILTIMYTSGSSGVPKGVMLTHHNLVHNIKTSLTLLPLEAGQRAISFLPFSHILERMACYGYIAFGVSLYFSQNKESFAHDFKTVKPVFCTSVPRVLEKMYDFLQEQLLDKNFFKKKIISWALAVGQQYEYRGQLNILYSFKLFLARVFVLHLWRKKLGGRIRYMVVGAAALRPEIGRLFSAAGIHIAEGYGMTETAPLISMNRFEPGLNRFGTVGLIIPGVEVKIETINEKGEGEILVKGPNVMPGYFKRPELTHEIFTEDGWLRTGDIGKFVHTHFLQITDRKKDIFKTSAGKYIAPLPLQTHFAQSPFIQRCLIIGFHRPFVTALIVPHADMLQAWCQQEHIHWTSLPFMIHNIKVRAKMEQEVAMLNDSLPPVERVRNFVLCDHDWTTERGEMTTTFKPVRQALLTNYEREIEKMYE
jgi:long-chain acyl-CoA synthetase